MNLATPTVSEQSLPVHLDEIALAIGTETDPLKLREYILRIEHAMLQNAESGIEGFAKGVNCVPLEHDFADGLYLRKGIIPKGMVIVGKIHKQEHFNIVLSGDISVLDESGIHRYKTGDIIKSPAGAKRLGYAHEDTTWVNLHVTQERDLALIEQQVTADSYEEIGLVGLPIQKMIGG